MPGTIDLGNVNIATIPSVGSATGVLANFGLRFSDCKGYSQVRYRFTTTGSANWGTLPMRYAGTNGYATGVEVRVQRSDSTLGALFGFFDNLALNTYYSLADHGYVQGCSGSCNYQVGMRALLVRSSASATPGVINAQMQMQVTYN